MQKAPMVTKGLLLMQEPLMLYRQTQQAPRIVFKYHFLFGGVDIHILHGFDGRQVMPQSPLGVVREVGGS
jgi:hypothetical protein